MYLVGNIVIKMQTTGVSSMVTFRVMKTTYVLS